MAIMVKNHIELMFWTKKILHFYTVKTKSSKIDVQKPLATPCKSKVSSFSPQEEAKKSCNTLLKLSHIYVIRKHGKLSDWKKELLHSIANKQGHLKNTIN